MKLLDAASHSLMFGTIVMGSFIGSTGSPQAAPLMVEKQGSYSGEQSLQYLWEHYKERFLHETGRIVDNVNGYISHSEGQGYGMLLALKADDKQAFDKIWSFAKSVLQTDDHLFAWRYRPYTFKPVSSLNNATDGDLLIAWALLEASNKQWGIQYGIEGRKIAAAILKLSREVHGAGLFLLPAKQGFEGKDGRLTLNPSYWIFPAYQRIGELLNDNQWQKLHDASIQFLQHLTHKGYKTAPNWISVNPRRGLSTAKAVRKAEFGYEAIRIPLYLLMGATEEHKHLADALLSPALSQQSGQIHITNVKSGRHVEPFHDAGYGALAALANCAMRSQHFPQMLTAKIDKNYYPATLQLLALFSAEERFSNCF